VSNGATTVGINESLTNLNLHWAWTPRFRKLSCQGNALAMPKMLWKRFQALQLEIGISPRAPSGRRSNRTS